MYRVSIIKTTYILAFLTIFTCCRLFANSSSTSIKIYFNQGSYQVTDSCDLQQLTSFVDSIRPEISHITISGFSSPEGSLTRNMELSELRSEAVKGYLCKTMGLSDSLITMHCDGVAWDELGRLVTIDDMSYTPAVLKIIEDTPEAYRNAQLKAIDHGIMYIGLFENIYPLLRYADVTIDYIEKPRPSVEPKTIEIEPNKIEVVPETATIINSAPEAAVTMARLEPESETKPLFAIKTNLLFDLATLINFELEFPIRDRWSIAAEYIFPWWVMDNHAADSRRNRLQLLNGNLEGRYWWGDRSSKPILTGWFTGLYTGVGSYDLEHDAKGYQGEFFIAAGVSGGYSHTINRSKNLRLEYSLGFGYMSTDYKYYYAEFCENGYWHAIEQRSGKYSWFGPTRAKVSLSWLINSKQKK